MHTIAALQMHLFICLILTLKPEIVALPFHQHRTASPRHKVYTQIIYEAVKDEIQYVCPLIISE